MSFDGDACITDTGSPLNFMKSFILEIRKRKRERKKEEMLKMKTKLLILSNSILSSVECFMQMQNVKLKTQHDKLKMGNHLLSTGSSILALPFTWPQKYLL